MTSKTDRTGITEIATRDFKNTYGLTSPANQSSRKTFSDSFKMTVIQDYLNGLERKEILTKYDLSPSTFHSWIRAYTAEQKESTSLQYDNEEHTDSFLQKVLIENETLKKIILMLLDI